MNKRRTIHRRTPSKWWWFAAYCALNAAVFFAFTVYGFLFWLDPATPAIIGTETVYLTGPAIIAITIPLGLAFAIGPILPKADWAWRYNMSLLWFGIASFYLLPLAIPLATMWYRSDMKYLYRHDKTDPTPLPQTL